MTLYSSEIEWEKNGYGYDDAVGFIPKSGSSGYDAEQDTKINKNTQDIATNTTNDEIRQQQVDTNTEKIETIGKNAFYYCATLTNITIPDTVTSIEEEAFYFCEELKSIEFGSKLKHIGDYAFLEFIKLMNQK